MYCAPWSNCNGGVGLSGPRVIRVDVRPPAPNPASNTVTLTPFSAIFRAAVAPAIPDPKIATLLLLEEEEVLRMAHVIKDRRPTRKPDERSIAMCTQYLLLSTIGLKENFHRLRFSSGKCSVFNTLLPGQ